MKIAPTLVWLLTGIWYSPDPNELKKCQAELRALLAVAKAARACRRAGYKDDPSWLIPMSNALARLEKVSKP